ncbi:hypothetical protein Saso_17760 [Streptomyces asoensis]|uniref:Uncharacterized protein n=1 Tax=Streptomyces asoensis TaxID=249586 RepID=A0ABQ3RW87_9ACTN|nr:hypothetical protein GCM10010496_35210 [Streptomyces asoensis]GHI60126.1 hypothetical protein Saso_17760 [Streptomyces asoensis]
MRRGRGEEFTGGQRAGRLAAERETGRAGQSEYLAATEVDGESLGQHSVMVSAPGGRGATACLRGGGARVTDVCVSRTAESRTGKAPGCEGTVRTPTGR